VPAIKVSPARCITRQTCNKIVIFEMFIFLTQNYLIKVPGPCTWVN